MDGLADGEGSGGGGVGSGGGGGGAGGGGGGGGATFRRNRGVNWTEEETEQLLEAWSDRDVQLLLENGPHNRQAFERVSFHLASRGMDKTPSQCREKIKKLKTVYRNLGAQGDGARVSRKIRGRLVQKLHQVMGGLPVAQPMTSVAPREPEKTIEDRSDDFGAGFHHGTQDFFATTSVGDGSSSDAEGGGSAEAARSASLREASSGGGVGGVGGGSSSSNGRRRHRRRSSGSPSASTRALHVLVDKIVAAQAGCTERLAALEERRMLLDKELEEKRLEAEGRRQEAQRQHELRLLSTMAQQMANVLKSLNPLTFAGARGCENGAGVGVPQGVADAAKAHDGVVAVVGVADQCGVVDNYGHPEGAVYSTM